MRRNTRNSARRLDVPLEVWLQRHTFPLEARYADAGFAERVYADLVGDLLDNGTTTAVYFATIHEEATRRLVDACLKKGQRAFVGKVAMDNPEECPPWYRDASAEAAISGRQNPWPDEPFDIGGLANTEGHITLGVQRLVLADGVALKDAKLDIALEGAKVDVKAIEGGMLGGRGRIAMQIAGSGAGAEASGTLSLTGGKLETLLAPATTEALFNAHDEDEEDEESDKRAG